MNSIRILLADDHGIVREGLRELLDAQPDMKVVAEAETALQALALARELDVDVVVMDLTMPGGGELEAIRQIREARADVHVLALTMHDEAERARAVLAAGGSGYLTKRAPSAELLLAIRSVHAGRSHISVSLGRQAPGGLLERQREPHEGASPAVALTGREADVLALLAQGHSNREAADKLGIGVRTVETYRARLAEKLGLQGRAELVRYAREHGLLDPRGV